MHPAFSFAKLIQNIQPTASELARAAGHAHTIKRRLESSFKLKKFLQIGSHARKTALKRFSDVDIMAVFSRSEARRGGSYISSATFLDNIRQDLQQRYLQTDIARDQQAVVVKFGAGDYSVDVVPAIFWGFNEKRFPIYMIPDGNGDWMTTSPEVHGKYIITADQKSGGKLKKTAQLLKYWRECRTPRIPISSFHIELLLASYEVCLGPKSYAKCLEEIFLILSQRECRALRDPLRISGNISAVKTDSQRTATLHSIVYALDHAQKALNASLSKNQAEACRQWNIVFNGQFPY